MSLVKLPPYILQELPDISDIINSPLKSAQRIKYTCFDVSKNLIAFGATSGGIYVFNKNPCELVQLIPNREGIITKVAISPNEKYFAFANGKGLVTVTECGPDVHAATTDVCSKEHQGNEITALIWSTSSSVLYVGDDVGKVSILQIPSFITKTMFSSLAQVIMNLDSRVCQLDIKNCMLLVSTLTRCYICDTTKEQFRQIGQKLRDGDYGACFVTLPTLQENGTISNHNAQPIIEQAEIKTYNNVSTEDVFMVSDKLPNTLVYCARPSSRLWEATVDGAVQRTHQFKQVLARPPSNVVTAESYKNENVSLTQSTTQGAGQSCNFAKIYSMKNGTVFSYKRDALYFLNFDNVENSTWIDKYKDIQDCRVYQDSLFVWLQDGSLITLLFLKIDKYLIKCYIEGKFVLCAELCAMYRDFLLTTSTLSPKLNILVGLKEKVINNDDVLSKIELVLEKLNNMKTEGATQLKSGIYVVDNAFHTQATILDDNEIDDANKFNPLSDETLQTFKDLSLSVSDKFSSSKKMLKEKWDDLEDKVKNFGTEKHYPLDVLQPGQTLPEIQENPVVIQDDIIYEKESSQTIQNTTVDNNHLNNERCKSLYQYFRLSVVKEIADESNNLCHIVESYSCDISEVYKLFLQLENYCLSIGSPKESKFIPCSLFLNYLNVSANKDELLNAIIEDEVLYKYFVDSCIVVNIKTQKSLDLACECGFPLPYMKTNQTPAFPELIDEFIEKQWSTQARSQCYDICKQMPYLWRKILYLRRNEDLENVLNILLQMLDERLLHTFLPQFTLNTWDRAIELYATLHGNLCLNCGKRFESINVKETLSWDGLGALVIKSVGGRDAIKLMEKHAQLIGVGDMTMKFYHASLLVTLFEKYDGMVRSQLTDTIYCAFDHEDARNEMFNIISNSLDGEIKNTSLPLIVAAKSSYWGLCVNMPLKNVISEEQIDALLLQEGENSRQSIISNLSFSEVLQHLTVLTDGVADCKLCGLPLVNEVLIRDGGLYVFRCGHTFHGACLDLLKVKLCPSCTVKAQ